MHNIVDLTQIISIHKILFAKGIFVVENLTNLDIVPLKTGREVIVLPFKIKANSALARVIVRF
jgi:kynurenine formamidase